jgi:hypothetical protein
MREPCTFTGISRDTTSDRDAEIGLEEDALVCGAGIPTAELATSRVSFETGAIVVCGPRPTPKNRVYFDSF